jgi:hypothetical protein
MTGRQTAESGRRARRAPTKILVIDIGGTNLKMLASGQHEPRRIKSGATLTPAALVAAVAAKCAEWEYEAVSIGYPGLVGSQGPQSEPGNLGPGWVGFDFAAAFARPVRILNDAAMQALGSYDGGRMLFLGLGTGLGSALIAQNVVVPLELGVVPWRGGRPLFQVLGRDGLKRVGRPAWRAQLLTVVDVFAHAFSADYVVLGGGNARLVKRLAPGVRIGNNLAAFRGGFRLWNLSDIPTLSVEGEHERPAHAKDWRVI